jgi:hypothetical protein
MDQSPDIPITLLGVVFFTAPNVEKVEGEEHLQQRGKTPFAKNRMCSQHFEIVG